MASISTPRIATFKADGSIAKGKFVKAGHAEGFVAVAAANTDRVIGVAAAEVTASDGRVEVYLPGGGGKVLAGESVSFGNDLVSHTDGTGVKPNAEGDQIGARCMEDGAASDLVSCEIYLATAHASQ
jgi:hypothetical protein